MTAQTQSLLEITQIPLSRIHPSPMNPRKHFDEKGIEELADSIFNNGMIQPITVRPHPLHDNEYEIVCGERRYRAKNKLLDRIPGADFISCIIKEMSDEVAMDMIIAENLQREDISPMEEAAGFLTLMKVRHIDAKEIAAKVGKSPHYVAQRLKLNDLNDDWQRFLHEHHLSIKDALTISSLSSQAQEELYKTQIADNHWDKGELYEPNDWDFRKFQNSLINPPFDPDDASLVPDFGACGRCRFNSAFDGLLFPELASNPVCRNTSCFQAKCDASFQSRFEAAIEDPTVVIITGEHSPSKQTNLLVKKVGTGVLTYGDYDRVEEPEEPQFEYYNGNNDTHEEDVEDFERAKNHYAQELETFNKSVRTGKYKKAFVLGGDNKGREVLIKITTKKAKVEAKQKPGAAEAVTTTAADIKESIKDIRDRETRAIELDDSKIWAEVIKLIGPASNAKEITGVLTELERKAVAMSIYDKLNHHRRDGFRKMFGLKEKDYTLQIPDDIDITQITQMLRYFFLDALPQSQINGAFKQYPKVSMIMQVVTSYWPDQIAAIKAKQAGTAQRRAQRVKDRIEALNKELKALLSPAKVPAVPSVPKKAASPDASKMPSPAIAKLKRVAGKKPIAKKKTAAA